MSLSVLRASSQYITSPALVTAYPFTVGCWVKMLSVSATTNVIWAITDNAGDSIDHWRLHIDANEDFVFNSVASSVTTTVTITTGVIAANTWNYVICRGIDATNRRMSRMLGTGAIAHGQSVTSNTPTGLDVFSIGILADLTPSFPADAEIAEFFYTNTDIQPGGAQLSNDLFLSLAQEGPLSVPHVRDAIVEYLPFSHSILGDKGDYFAPRVRRNNWAAVNAPTLGPQPPVTLANDYRKIETWRRRAKAPAAGAAGFGGFQQYYSRFIGRLGGEGASV